MKKQFSIRTKISLLTATLLLLISLESCDESEYSKLVKNEMAKDIVNDSLFLGLKLGQTQSEFFATCWKLNQDNTITNSATEPFVEYVLPTVKENGRKSDIHMLFYGDFNEKKVMTGMEMQFFYVAWSLWNKSLYSDELIHSIKDTLETWYPGNDFIKVPIEKNNTEILVKVDGNRRITIRPLDNDKIVKVKIDDLRYVLNE